MKTVVEKRVWAVGRNGLPERVRAVARLVGDVVVETVKLRRDMAKRYPGVFED